MVNVEIVAAAILFSVLIIGIFAGWVISGRSEITTMTGVRLLITVVVTMVWILAVVADILITEYTISPLLHGIMGAIVGYFFTQEGIAGLDKLRRDSNEKKERKRKNEQRKKVDNLDEGKQEYEQFKEWRKREKERRNGE